ncbi:hypothetical protein C8F01DRAFT_1363356 [Mycena amicta]|nr:hypothetical protein C8F01DRAFT_1363356 [Mycena amicta]
MQSFPAQARDVFTSSGQNTPSSHCQSLLGVCMEDAAGLVFIALFVAGLLSLSCILKLRARTRRGRPRSSTLAVVGRTSTPNPPPYSSIGFPPSSSRDSLCKGSSSSSPNPSLDPYHVIPTSFDRSLRLQDDPFVQPERAFPGRVRHDDSRILVHDPLAGPPSPLTPPPPPAYVPSRRGAFEDAL